MLLILLCLILGILIGFVVPYQIPVIAAKYVSISFLAGLDSVLGATKAGLENKFSLSVFFSGFFVNLTLAALLTWVGDMLGVEIYQAALVTFGMRIFLNLGYIRHDILHKENSKSILEKFIRQEK